MRFAELAPGRDLALTAALTATLLALTLVVALGPDPLPGEVASIRTLQSRSGWARDSADLIRRVTGTGGAIVAIALVSPFLLSRYRWRALTPLAIALVTVLVIQPAFKELIDRARPSETQVEVLAVWTSKAYPSGHAIGTTIVAAYLTWLCRRRWPHSWVPFIPLLLIPATVLSSLVQGVHWPSDLLGGMLVGGLAAWLMARTTPAGSVSSRS